MKRCIRLTIILTIVTLTILSLAISTKTNAASSEISVSIDSRPIYFDVAPQKLNGRVMVPIRAIFESLGAEVTWNNETQTITGTKEGNNMTLHVDAGAATMGGKTVQMDVPATKINGRVFVPTRFVAESFGADVKWDESNKKVTISTGAIAPDGTYYFVYNSKKVTVADLTAIKLYINKFRDSRNVLFDSTAYSNASQVYDALKAKQKQIGGSVTGVQIFGIEDDVPAFSYIHKVQVIPATERWNGVEFIQGTKYFSDFCYSTFKNDSKYLNTDVAIFDVFEQNIPFSFAPEWPVSRLPLTKGEIAKYIDRYNDYRKQIAEKAVPTVVLSVPSNIQDGFTQNDAAFFINRLKSEFNLFEKTELRTYSKELNKNLIAENKSGPINLMVSSPIDNEGAKQGKEYFMNRETVNKQLNANYYTAFFWGINPANRFDTDDMIYDGMTQGKMINPIVQTVSASNSGLNNYIWAPVEQDSEGQWLNDYVPATYEMLQENNPYYFIYQYYAGLNEGKTRLQSFHDAKVEYATQTMKHQDKIGFMSSYENIISLHYLGLADYE
ncbi:copper amine oxidase N-terminal domain-containing protein [Paenibacillus sp. NPDC058177]|uniref:copper amine oxidase N-terminal domain-containing protein n=1 Tax=Paenibacillus sp. NPDC058177 TaxID=3346369 RepID=UPI0036DA9234